MEMAALPLGSRRNEDIALDLMKFIAMTTGYGKTTGAGVGFQGGGGTRQARGICRSSAGTLWAVFAVGGREVRACDESSSPTVAELRSAGQPRAAVPYASLTPVTPWL